MSATTAPTQSLLWSNGTHRHGGMVRSDTRCVRVAVFLFDHAADRPRTRRAADRRHRQHRRNPAGAPGVVLTPEVVIK